MKILDITPGEKLLIERNRRNETQQQAAERMGIKRISYGKLERDSEEPEAPKVGMLLFGYERCIIYRIRKKLTQIEIAKQLNYSRYTVNKIENGKTNATRLVDFWETDSGE